MSDILLWLALACGGFFVGYIFGVVTEANARTSDQNGKDDFGDVA